MGVGKLKPRRPVIRPKIAAAPSDVTRLTVDLPTACHVELKVAAARKNQSIRDYVLDALRAAGLKWE